MTLILVFNKYLPRVHMELELGMLGVHRKLVKYVVHSSKRKKLKKNYFSSHKLPKQQLTSFWSQGILGVNKAPYQLSQIHFCILSASAPSPRAWLKILQLRRYFFIFPLPLRFA
jgi:hypothetical protein